MATTRLRLVLIAVLGLCGVLGFVVCVVILFVRCLPFGPVKEDWWGAYKAGGFFESGKASLSSDGKTVLYASPRSGRGDIYEFDLAERTDALLVSSPDPEATPVRLPNGRELLFERLSVGGLPQIWMRDATTLTERLVTPANQSHRLSAVSPDGHWLLSQEAHMTGGLGAHAEDYLFDLTTNNFSVKKVGGFSGPQPFSLHGQMVLSPSSNFDEVWIEELNTGVRSYVGPGTAPSISRDGQHILASSSPASSGLHERWVLTSPDGKKREMLGELNAPFFCSDSKTIIDVDIHGETVTAIHIGDASRRKINLPRGHKIICDICDDRVLIRIVGADRVGVLYLLNTNDWSFVKVTDMK